MEKEEILLGLEMTRLNLEPVKLNDTKSIVHPLSQKYQSNAIPSTVTTKESECACSNKIRNKCSGILKKKSKRILKEPLLKLLKSYGSITNIEIENCHRPTTNLKCDPLNLCSLVQNCNMLKISSSTTGQKDMVENTKIGTKWCKSLASSSQDYREPRQQANSVGTCSQQALNPPCDITIDELASYFETLVHIPKKMSSMAEMMYI